MSEPFVSTARPERGPTDAALSTFLLTDIEGSTRLWEEHAARMGVALAIYHARLREALPAAEHDAVLASGRSLGLAEAVAEAVAYAAGAGAPGAGAAGAGEAGAEAAGAGAAGASGDTRAAAG